MCTLFTANVKTMWTLYKIYGAETHEVTDEKNLWKLVASKICLCQLTS